MPDPRHYFSQLNQGHWFAALPPALSQGLLDIAQVQRLDAGPVSYTHLTLPTKA